MNERRPRNRVILFFLSLIGLIIILSLFIYILIDNTRKEKTVFEEYHSDIKNISKNHSDSILFETIWIENDEEPYYVINYHFKDGTEDYFSDSLDMFLTLLEYVNSNSNSPLYQKRIEMLVSENTEYNNGILVLKNYGRNNEIDYRNCISISCTSSRITSIDGSEKANGSLLYLNLVNVQNIEVDTFFELNKLKELKLKNCKYRNGEAALNENDISLLLEHNTDMKIVVE